ncbi:hypothetical protein GWI33_012923 [Rhynchophorus ferrugineus]|uniref:Odorant receptor n=1 Tax=Rhynchophorus ferrugineus TaxID=354439 RepID=A0A834I4Q4_RHYFE|nr:hypothetical protein GWI33_012923 [Rhynchophorus ferrugineus]
MFPTYRSYFYTDLRTLLLFGGWIQLKATPSWNTTSIKTLAAIGYVVFICLMGQLKSVLLFKNRAEFKKLILDLDQKLFRPIKLIEEQLVNNTFAFFWKIKTALIVVSYISVTSLLLIPLFYEREQGLPIQAWYPFNESLTPNYQIVYVHQAIAIYYISSINIYVDVIVAGLCTFIGLQCDLLCQRLENVGEYGTEKEIKKDFVDCINHHYTIIEFLQTTENVFGQIYFGQIFASTIALCMDLFLLSLTEPTTFEFFYLVVYQLAISNLLFVPCWFATEMTRKSENIPNAAYSWHWIDLSISFKKELIIFIRRSQHPLKLYAANFFELSVQTFLTIFRSSLSYYAVLSNLNMEE